MYVGKIVFAQLVDHLPTHTFRRCVIRYRAAHEQRCWIHIPSATPVGSTRVHRGDGKQHQRQSSYHRPDEKSGLKDDEVELGEQGGVHVVDDGERLVAKSNLGTAEGQVLEG